MNEDPLIIFAILAGTIYLLKIWREDYLGNQQGNPHPKALPGAWPAPRGLIWLAIAAACALVLIETAGELVLGVSAEQSDVVAIALIAWVCAGVIEEVIFRGMVADFLKPKMRLLSMVLLLSAAFALGHVQYWIDFPESEIKDFARDPSLLLECRLNIGTKSLWTLSMLFANSLLFFAVRFVPQNAKHSLLPCFAAHISSNVAVFLVKLYQGHVVGWWPVAEKTVENGH